MLAISASFLCLTKRFHTATYYVLVTSVVLNTKVRFLMMNIFSLLTTNIHANPMYPFSRVRRESEDMLSSKNQEVPLVRNLHI